MYVKQYQDEYGRTRRYFRYKGLPLVPLPGRPGSPEFWDAYNIALAEARAKKPVIGAARLGPGTMGAVITSYFNDPSFKAALAKSSQGMRRRILEKIAAKYGDRPIKALQTSHVGAILTGLKPFERDNWLKSLRGVMKYAIETGVIATDPTAGFKKSKAKAGTIHTWNEDEIAQFEARHGIGSMPRLALALLLCTAQRISDVVRMGPRDVKAGTLYVRQQKTQMDRQDRELAIPILPELRKILDATPIGNLVFLVTSQGVPFTRGGLGVRFHEWCQQAGLRERCSSHGLRKAGLVRLAEAGCTEAELRAISGHKNIAELKPYIEKAEQKRLAESAMNKLMASRQGGNGTGTHRLESRRILRSATERGMNESVSETVKVSQTFTRTQ